MKSTNVAGVTMRENPPKYQPNDANAVCSLSTGAPNSQKRSCMFLRSPPMIQDGVVFTSQSHKHPHTHTYKLIHHTHKHYQYVFIHTFGTGALNRRTSDGSATPKRVEITPIGCSRDAASVRRWRCVHLGSISGDFHVRNTDWMSQKTARYLPSCKLNRKGECVAG